MADHTGRDFRYSAQERAWVRRILARLSPDQRARYERECAAAPRHPHSGKLYDGAKARIAERILYEHHLHTSTPEAR